MINFWKTWKFPQFLSIFGQKNTSKMIFSGLNIDFHKNFPLTSVDQHKMLYQMGYKMVIFALFATQNPRSLPPPKKICGSPGWIFEFLYKNVMFRS